MAKEKKESFVNTANTRPGVYDAVIKDIAEKKVCPFCPEQLANFHKNPILIEKKYWLATDSMYPYTNAKNHILFVHKNHLEHFSDLSKEAREELWEIAEECLSLKKMAGGTLLMRFGDTRYTGASVNHLHAHIICGDPEKEKREIVLARVG